MFAFGGTEVIGITAGEAQNPRKVIPQAINSVPVRILLFYVLTLGVIMCIQPWNKIDGNESPFVSIFSSIGFSSEANVLNFIVITAALSAINADIFDAGRMIHGMAKQGQTPQMFTKTTANGVPWVTSLSMIGALLIGVVLNIWFEDQIFFLIAALATSATVVVWSMILISHIRMKHRIDRDALEPSAFPVPLWPVGSYLALAFMIFVIILIGIIPETRSARSLLVSFGLQSWASAIGCS